MAMEMTDELLTGQKVTKAHLDIAERPPVEHVMSYTYRYVRHADSWPLMHAGAPLNADVKQVVSELNCVFTIVPTLIRAGGQSFCVCFSYILFCVFC